MPSRKMDDWQDEPTPPLQVKEQHKINWDDEDADGIDVKESWEDEDDSTSAPTLEPPAENGTKNMSKAGDKKAKTSEIAKEASLDPLAQKLQQQRIADEGDPKSSEELFTESGDEKSLDNLIPKSETDFLEYANLISQKLHQYERSYYYVGLLKSVMRLSMVVLKAADAKEIASSVTAVANEKLKAEKEADGHKRKAGCKKKKLYVDKPEDDAHLNAYDAVVDYDSM
ncbi:Eukaryotic translation initiation factor 3 subunit J [Camellia lanceoleosa]|uniref:Eukaryotic translation initiation factor 3 subunit J n=1 Tax=Camellia lanceoleosa TaxID=1840588 RepID=A0ACC0G3T1_9ERIC|nr:Eukaryotic translation initiation factor 3 subunit J [Camellia lanceoleosa]